MSQCSDLLRVLSDGREHEMRDIHRAIGFCRLNSRVAELRSRGHNIVCRKTNRMYFYRLVTALTERDNGSLDTERGAGGTPKSHLLSAVSVNVPDGTGDNEVSVRSVSAVALAGASKATGREATWGASADGNHPVASAPASVTQLDLFGAAA